MTEIQIMGTAGLRAPIDRHQDLDMANSYKDLKKRMITELGEDINFRTIKKRIFGHGGEEISRIYNNYIPEKHAVRRTNRKDDLVREGTLSLEDIYIEAPYDSKLRDFADYQYQNRSHQILDTSPIMLQGQIIYIKAFGKKIPQQGVEESV